MSKLEDRIFLRFDDKSKNEALEFIKSGKDRFDSIYLADLMMKGRNATETRTLVRERFSARPDSEIHSKDYNDIDDDTIISMIKENDRPANYELSRDRWLSVFDQVKKLLAEDLSGSAVFNYLRFLIDFENMTIEPHIIDPEVVALAQRWCAENTYDSNARIIMQDLLNHTKDRKLLPLAWEILDTPNWDVKSVYLMVAIMDLSPDSESHYLFKSQRRIFESFDYILLPKYVYSTNCSRRSFKHAKKYMDKRKQLDVMFSFFARRLRRNRFIYKWIHRFFRRNKNSKTIKRDLITFIHILRSKEIISIAKEVRLTADEKFKMQLTEALIAVARDKDCIEFAKEYIEKFPDAPVSFRLMILIAKYCPEKSVPWLDEWHRTAVGTQKLSALRTLIGLAPTKEYINLASELVSDVADENNFRAIRSKLLLMVALYKADPNNEVFDLVEALKTRYHRRYPRHLKKLVRLIEGA